MSQHFLLSSQARGLSLLKIATMSDADVCTSLQRVRWSDNNGEPVCPHCGSQHKRYHISTRKQYKCKECSHTFSLTSGTIFASHKLDLRMYLIAIALFTNSAKGISALQPSRELDVQYKTAWVLAHKIRESLIDDHQGEELKGVCEIDGVYVNGYVRPKNHIDDRVDRRKVHKLNKRVVISIRQRVTEADECIGAVKTRTFVINREEGKDIKDLVYKTVQIGSEVHADEHFAYDDLHAHYDMRRVNHSKEYSGMFGENNNQSESYNSKFRRMQYGNMYKLGNLYLSNYANEISYREDTRRWSNLDIFNDIVSKCIHAPTSRDFNKYWQGNKRLSERLGT